MVLLTYSRGRGHGGDAAGRGGRGRGRGRSMTWERTPPPRAGSRAAAPAPRVVAVAAPLPRGAGAAPRAGGNRVWVNAAVRGSYSGYTAMPPTTPAAPSNQARRSAVAVSVTSKSRNRVWTKSSTDTTAQMGGAGSGAGQASNAIGSINKLATLPQPSSVPAAPASSFRGVASTAPRSGDGHLVWTNNAPGRGRAGGRGGPARNDFHSANSSRTTFQAKQLSTAAAAALTRNAHEGVEKVAGVAKAPSRLIAAPSALNVAPKAPAGVRPKPTAAASSSTTRPYSHAGSTGRNLKVAPAAPAPAPTPTVPSLATRPVARYSGSASQQRNAAAVAATRAGRAQPSRHPKVGQKVARYSGAGRGVALSSNTPSGRGGTSSRFTHSGRSMLAWQGRGRTTTAGRGAGVRGYYNWPLGSRRGLPATQARWAYNLAGRGWGRIHSRYSAWPPGTARFGTHSASRWMPASRWAHLWAGRDGRDRWRGRGRGRSAFSSPAGRSRHQPRGRQVLYKNRTLIRVRSLLPQQQPALATTATLAGAIARRASLAAGVRFAKLRNAMPMKFVRSGKHGMAIRRVDSSALAARRAAAATASSPAAKRPKVSVANIGARSTVAGATAAGGGGGGGGRASNSSVPPALGAKATAAGPAAKSDERSASSAPAAVRKAALLDKAVARARSVTARRAAAVVAGARAKRSRLQLVRNMTLYRGKGQVTVVGAKDGTGEEAAATKKKTTKVQKTAEPCLFFCRFGKCSKSDEECRFVHDKSKVAVCRAFLSKGGCDKGDKCLLTHAVQAEKMPVCIYFEKGMCFTPNCPYLHVKVSKNAAVCPRFLKGYCPDGTTCRLKHELPDRRKRKRHASIGGDLGDGDGDASTTARSKQKRSTPASETEGAGGEEGLAASASTASDGGDGPSEGRSGKSVLRPPSAELVEVAESERKGAGGAGAAIVPAAHAGGSGSDGSATTTGCTPPSWPEHSQGDEGGSVLGEVEGGGAEPAAIGQTQGALDGEDDEIDEDDDLKPVFLRKRKRR